MEQETVGGKGGKRLRGRSIGHRIAVLVATTVLTAVLAVTAVFAYVDITSDFETRKRSLEATGYVFASAVADHMVSRDQQESLRVLRAISRIPDITYAAVLNPDDTTFASLGSAIIVDPSNLHADLGILDALRGGVYPVAVDVIKSGQVIGKVLLIADVSDLRQQLFGVLFTSLAVAFVAIASSFLVARRMQRRITAPIKSLTAAMQEIRADRAYDSQVVNDAEGETGQMIDSFNAMITEVLARDLALERHRQTLEATVEQRTSELLHARDAAEQANQAKSSFLATMSHEIRTPLNGLMVMAELLAGARLDQRLQRYAEVIVKSGQSLLTIINDILDLSKIEAGKLELERIVLDPANIADDVTSLFWEKASSKGLDLAARVAPGMPRGISGDPVRLNQILSNLVNNALKFTETGQVLISLQYDAGQLTMAVTDSGIGIPKEKLDHLFEAFSQADQSITRKFGGTGLGLAICKRLAEAMGGSIGVNSRQGQGSTFWVRIPAESAGGEAKPLPGPVLRAGLAVHGLASQSALGTALTSAGFTAQIVDSDISGMDIVFATADRIASLDPGPGRRPSIICLGWIGDQAGETAIAEGRADDLIIMPLRQQDITEMIARIRTGRLRGRAVLERGRTEQHLERHFTGRRVLVADDNAVNREVIIEVLRQLGVELLVAVNGREAVEIWKREQPDLIFMDCSMPEMDGYSATREIRAHEALAVVGGHVPVIALTAHVAGTDGETWRDAGMDAYMTKPFTLKQIVRALESQFAGLPVPVAPVELPVGEVVLDGAVLDELRQIGGNESLFRRVLDLFAGRVPQAVDKVKDMVEANDLSELADAAHALKSMCANIGAHRAVSACHELERAARSKDDFDVADLVANINTEVLRVMQEVERLRAA